MSAPAHAVITEVGSSPAKKPAAESAPTESSYLRSCQGAFEAVQSGSVERHFVDGVTDEASAMQLMADFGLFTKEYRSALLLTLKNRGVVVPPKRKQFYADDARTIALGIKKILDLPERQFHAFSLEVLNNLKKIASAGPSESEDEKQNKAHGVIAKERLSRILRATLSSSKRELFIKLFEQVTRSSLLNTAKPLLLESRLVYSRDRWYEAAYLTEAFTRFVISATFWPLDYNNARKMRRTAAKMGEIPSVLHGFLIHNLLVDYEKSLFDPSVSLQGACTKGVCNLTPVQIAYLGHLELTEIAITKIEMNEALKQFGITEGLGSIREAAVKLHANPTSYRDQLILMANINSLTQNYNSILNQVRLTLITIDARTKQFQDALKQLGQMPYQLTRKNLDEASLNKHELLIIKFRSDLKLLTEAKSEQTTLLRFLEDLAPHLDELKGISQNPSPDTDWAEVTDKLLRYTEDLAGEQR